MNSNRRLLGSEAGVLLVVFAGALAVAESGLFSAGERFCISCTMDAAVQNAKKKDVARTIAGEDVRIREKLTSNGRDGSIRRASGDEAAVRE